MKKLRHGLIVLSMLFCSATFAGAQVNIGIGIGLPNLSIGINLPLYPELAPVPGYPVYYAPQLNANYFFYDGMYWVYQDDNWYASTWYNGPWALVEPYAVPVFVLRIPVRYYRQPPVYFRGWHSNAPPRWGQHWGREWERRRGGWDRWDRSSVPARAPRPTYQRQYSGDRYPRQLEQQHSLRSRSYRYQPRDTAVRQHIRQQPGQRTSAPPCRSGIRSNNSGVQGRRASRQTLARSRCSAVVKTSKDPPLPRSTGNSLALCSESSRLPGRKTGSAEDTTGEKRRNRKSAGKGRTGTRNGGGDAIINPDLFMGHANRSFSRFEGLTG